jgi:hypothetical protein
MERLRAAKRVLRGNRLQLDGVWFTVRKDPTTDTGCNVYFDEIGNAYIKGTKRPFLIRDPFLADGIITLFLYRNEVKEMLRKPENEDLGPRRVHLQ